MSHIVNNAKGFKVIACTLQEISTIGGLGICDSCNECSFEGYYIAVLNHWYCPDCYQDWMQRAKKYPEDQSIEDRNFGLWSSLLSPAHYPYETCVLCGKETNVLRSAPVSERTHHIECCGQLCPECYNNLNQNPK